MHLARVARAGLRRPSRVPADREPGGHGGRQRRRGRRGALAPCRHKENDAESLHRRDSTRPSTAFRTKGVYIYDVKAETASTIPVTSSSPTTLTIFWLEVLELAHSGDDAGDRAEI